MMMKMGDIHKTDKRFKPIFVSQLLSNNKSHFKTMLFHYEFGYLLINF